VPAHVRRLQIDEVGRERERPIERLAVQQPPRLRLEGEDGVPGLDRAELVEPLAPVLSFCS